MHLKPCKFADRPAFRRKKGIYLSIGICNNDSTSNNENEAFLGKAPRNAHQS